MARWRKKDDESPNETQRVALRERAGWLTDRIGAAVTVLAVIICILLALHIAFTVFTANQANPIVRHVNDWADWFAWQFRDIFTPKDPKVGVLVNYGLAAVIYLVAGRVVSGLIRRIH